ncbi:hypothetical protein AAHN97_15120 [Chitinophaga niabensis]|uniref:hypothetical protein n=1 Tax=Chitinophaga niabensis TaxID=536979 RepID=UPI0031BB798A
MNLKNYTSEVPPDLSVSRIERKLVEIGATNISKRYEDGTLVAISFVILQNGTSIVLQLPARVERVFEVMWREVKRPVAGTKARTKEQAERTAWKIVSDWVDVQASMVLLEQAELLQVFLPYAMVSSTETLFDRMKGSEFKLLNAGINA